MSHAPERKEKDCLNCGTIVYGRYCHVCGQENIVPKENFWDMVVHFFSDITHFDGKFFNTVKVLFRKPGFLTREYQQGRRASYLHPIRMYVFTSAFFFLLFFTFFGPDSSDLLPEETNEEAITRFSGKAYEKAKTKEDSIAISNSIGLLTAGAQATAADSSSPGNADTVSSGEKVRVSLNKEAEKYSSIKEYDSVQHSLSSSKRDGWMRRIVMRKAIDLNTRYKGKGNQLSNELIKGFLHMLPYMLFVSLPLYALFLKLLYIRQRRQFFYVDHGIFLIHLYIFAFLIMIAFFLADYLQKETVWYWTWIVQVLLMIYGVLYTVKAMKNFYGQGWGKTILKFILFNIICLFCLGFLFILFLGVTMYRV